MAATALDIPLPAVAAAITAAAGEFMPFWMFPWFPTGTGPSFSTLRLQLHREDAIKLRKLLVTHPNAKGLGYTVLNK